MYKRQLNLYITGKKIIFARCIYTDGRKAIVYIYVNPKKSTPFFFSMPSQTTYHQFDRQETQIK